MIRRLTNAERGVAAERRMELPPTGVRLPRTQRRRCGTITIYVSWQNGPKPRDHILRTLLCDRCHGALNEPAVYMYVENKTRPAAFDRTTFDDLLCQPCARAVSLREIAARWIANRMSDA